MVSAGFKGVLDQEAAAKGPNSGVVTVTHTAPAETGVDLFGEDAGPLLSAPSAGKGTRAGRPNKRTAAVAAYIQRGIGDPLVELSRLAMCDLRELAKELKAICREVLIKDDITAMELLRFKRDMLNASLPYVHAKRAAEDDAGEAVRPTLTVNLGGLDPAALKIAPGGLDVGGGGFLDMVAVAHAQARYAPTEADNPAESPVGHESAPESATGST